MKDLSKLRSKIISSIEAKKRQEELKVYSENFNGHTFLHLWRKSVFPTNETPYCPVKIKNSVLKEAFDLITKPGYAGGSDYEIVEENEEWTIVQTSPRLQIDPDFRKFNIES